MCSMHLGAYVDTSGTTQECSNAFNKQMHRIEILIICHYVSLSFHYIMQYSAPCMRPSPTSRAADRWSRRAAVGRYQRFLSHAVVNGIKNYSRMMRS